MSLPYQKNEKFVKRHKSAVVIMVCVAIWLILFAILAFIFLRPSPADSEIPTYASVPLNSTIDVESMPEESTEPAVSDESVDETVEVIEIRPDWMIEVDAYNEQLSQRDIEKVDPFMADGINMSSEYMSMLNESGDGCMGSVEIPSIGIHIPIYHGTTIDVLDRYAGHMYGTSLPVGGLGTHSVIVGHSGLADVTLFTDLEEIQEGHYFYVHVRDEVLKYQVDQISVVLPTEMADYLEEDPEKDYVTLMTCTPYSVNTHRLLVRGIRVIE